MDEINLLSENKNIKPGKTLKKAIENKSSNVVFKRTIKRYSIPTSEEYNQLTILFYKINKVFFNKPLPEVLLSLSKNDGGKSAVIKLNVYQKNNHKCNAIIINYNITQKNHKDLLIELTHILVHYIQLINNEKSINSYHNDGFYEIMKQIGLSTNGTGKDRGKNTGQNVKHDIIEGGKFEKLLVALKDEDYLSWKSIAKSSKKVSKNKVAYKCPLCSSKVWGKANIEDLYHKHDNTYHLLKMQIKNNEPFIHLIKTNY